MQYVLDESVDQGSSPKKAFEEMQELLSQDLESFLYHLIYDEVEAGEFSYAEELIEGFLPYMTEVKWFRFLKAVIEVERGRENGYEALFELATDQKKSKDIELALEILAFLEPKKENYFKKIALKIVPHLRREQDFEEMKELIQARYGIEVDDMGVKEELKESLKSILKA